MPMPALGNSKRQAAVSSTPPADGPCVHLRRRQRAACTAVLLALLLLIFLLLIIIIIVLVVLRPLLLALLILAAHLLACRGVCVVGLGREGSGAGRQHQPC